MSAGRDGRDEFTDQEERVLRLLAAGKTDKQIGEALAVSEGTVQYHWANAKQKIAVRLGLAERTTRAGTIAAFVRNFEHPGPSAAEHATDRALAAPAVSRGGQIGSIALAVVLARLAGACWESAHQGNGEPSIESIRSTLATVVATDELLDPLSAGNFLAQQAQRFEAAASGGRGLRFPQHSHQPSREHQNTEGSEATILEELHRYLLISAWRSLNPADRTALAQSPGSVAPRNRLMGLIGGRLLELIERSQKGGALHGD